MDIYKNLKNYDVKNIAPDRLDTGEKLILSILLSMRNLPEINISIERLSWQASMSPLTTKRKIKLLEEKGLITRVSAGHKNNKKTILNELNIASLVAACSKIRAGKMNEFINYEQSKSLPINQGNLDQLIENRSL
ncbi:MAG TPA: Lrp/AsnC family transcriptional regulator [Bacteriovoracaceae bacterium]|nr:Lrp/AsnC family transcriptional regulator [Bacteriovoracaceae bacterium]